MTKSSTKSWRKAVWISAAALIAALMVLTISSTRMLEVRGASMTPEINEGEHVWLLTRFKTPIKGSVIVLHSPVTPPPMVLRRVIGLPGDVVEVRKGKVFVNDAEVEEDYVSPQQNQRQRDMSPVHVPDHSYFVMADNRDGAYDSRDWGVIPEQQIYGKVILSF